MDKRAQEILENFDRMKIGLDDKFKFHCDMCGNCCRNREDILLNPIDLFHLARELNTTPTDVYERFCESYLGNTSNMVIVRLKPVGPQKVCPLLDGNKCSVHSGKPTVCALYPLGRTMKGDATTHSFRGSELQYILQDISCGNDSEEHTVRSWLEEFDLIDQQEFYGSWVECIQDCSALMHRIIEFLPGRVVDMYASAIFVSMYLNYRVDKEFMPQFEENWENLQQLLESTRQQIGLFSSEENLHGQELNN